MCPAGSTTRRANLEASEAVLTTLKGAQVRCADQACGCVGDRQSLRHMMVHDWCVLCRRRSLSMSTARCKCARHCQSACCTRKQQARLFRCHAILPAGSRRCQDESIDELAAYLGVGDVVAAMTAKYDCPSLQLMPLAPFCASLHTSRMLIVGGDLRALLTVRWGEQ